MARDMPPEIPQEVATTLITVVGGAVTGVIGWLFGRRRREQQGLSGDLANVRLAQAALEDALESNRTALRMYRDLQAEREDFARRLDETHVQIEQLRAELRSTRRELQECIRARAEALNERAADREEMARLHERIMSLAVAPEGGH